MSVDPADGNIDFKVGPRYRPVQTKGYGSVLVVLLGILIVILMAIAGLQQRNLQILQRQVSTLTQHEADLIEQNKQLQRSVDACTGQRPAR